MDPEELATMCRDAAVKGELVTLWLPLDWDRPQGVPFVGIKPKASDVNAEGFAPWRWRPAALIEFVYETAKAANNPKPPKGATKPENP